MIATNLGEDSTIAYRDFYFGTFVHNFRGPISVAGERKMRGVAGAQLRLTTLAIADHGAPSDRHL